MLGTNSKGYGTRRKRIKALAREIVVRAVRRELDEGSFTEDDALFVAALRRIVTRVGGIDFAQFDTWTRWSKQGGEKHANS